MNYTSCLSLVQVTWDKFLKSKEAIETNNYVNILRTLQGHS